MKYPVLLPNIFDHPFTYESELKLEVGDYVKVNFGKKIITGVIWDQFEKNTSKQFRIKSIEKKINIKPLKRQTIEFLNWFSKYNIVPLGMPNGTMLYFENQFKNSIVCLFKGLIFIFFSIDLILNCFEVFFSN